jgi:hypothetical protein
MAYGMVRALIGFTRYGGNDYRDWRAPLRRPERPRWLQRSPRNDRMAMMMTTAPTI